MPITIPGWEGSVGPFRASTPDPHVRESTQRWLAERIHAVMCGCYQGHRACNFRVSRHLDDHPPADTAHPYYVRVAAAVLDSPGVEVEMAYEGDPSGPRISVLLPREAS